MFHPLAPGLDPGDPARGPRHRRAPRAGRTRVVTLPPGDRDGLRDARLRGRAGAEDERLAGERERLIADPGYESYAHRHHSYRARGRYAEQLRVLHDLFGPDRVLVLQSEALFEDPNAELDKVWDFIGVDPVRLTGLSPVKPSNHLPTAGAVELASLHDYYAPLNEELYSMPGVDFTWDPARSTQPARSA